jgi:hypothetical protein
MTVAVAAEYPWGRVRQVVESIPGSSLESGGAVILAADTRWTYRDRLPEDMGQKVWCIGPAVGAAFSGDVRSAEEALTKLRRLLRRAKWRMPQEFGAIASPVFQRVYSRHRAERADCGPLYLLVGMANSRGQTAVVYFSHTNGFSPLFLRGVNAIGWPPACDQFRERLERVVAEQLESGKSWPREIDVWAMLVTAALKRGVIDEGVDAKVGGLVQLLIVDRDGSRTVEVSSTGGDPMKAESWVQATAEHDRLKRYHGLYRVPYLASGKLDVGLHHISD